jgi:hypothetical protein
MILIISLKNARWISRKGWAIASLFPKKIGIHGGLILLNESLDDGVKVGC